MEPSSIFGLPERRPRCARRCRSALAARTFYCFSAHRRAHYAGTHTAAARAHIDAVRPVRTCTRRPEREMYIMYIPSGDAARYVGEMRRARTVHESWPL
ncbi:unnamed protein product, partial [Iphiclides podalirius]